MLLLITVINQKSHPIYKEYIKENRRLIANLGDVSIILHLNKECLTYL